MTLAMPGWVGITLVVIEYAIKIVAIGVVLENRRPSSSQAWLLLILLLPVVGLPLFVLIGSPAIQGRRHRIQATANQLLLTRTKDLPALPSDVAPSNQMAGVVRQNLSLTSIPCVLGTTAGLYPTYEDSIAAMTSAVPSARHEVNFEIYILALDSTTGPFFDALTDAVSRGVTVRVLYDHMGSRAYPGFRDMNKRMTADGIHWHQMLPIHPLRGRWRRPDLRNHRKLLVVDGEVSFMGSQNMIDSSYLSKANLKTGRRWQDLNVQVHGSIVRELSMVFALDWYTESGEVLDVGEGPADPPGDVAMQLLPSGPGFTTDPNLRLFNLLIYRAERYISIVSPYFIPDESLLMAITSAAQRGVYVELFAQQRLTSSWSTTRSARTIARFSRPASRCGSIPARRSWTPSSSPSTTTSR